MHMRLNEKRKTIVIYDLFIFLYFCLELKPHGWYLTLIQFGSYAIISKVDLMLRGQSARQIPLNIYGILAFVQLVTIGFSNARY